MSSLEAKIVVVGSQGVGKTSLVTRFCKGSFDPSQVMSTVGASFLTKRVVDSDSDTVVRLQIWDTGSFFPRCCFDVFLHTVLMTHLAFCSRPGTLPLHLAPLLPRCQCLHPLLQHHGRQLLRRDGHLAD